MVHEPRRRRVGRRRGGVSARAIRRAQELVGVSALLRRAPHLSGAAAGHDPGGVRAGAADAAVCQRREPRPDVGVSAADQDGRGEHEWRADCLGMSNCVNHSVEEEKRLQLKIENVRASQ